MTSKALKVPDGVKKNTITECPVDITLHFRFISEFMNPIPLFCP